MMTVPVGEPLLELIDLAYRADTPVLLHGHRGVGKSEIFAQAAQRLQIQCLVLDLSILEAPDLSGLPYIQDGRMHYAAPAFLPMANTKGLLLLEELNRSPRHLQTPCLQLLSRRQVNGYELPPGWLPCAAVNDAADGYFAEDLDPALLDRFLNARVVADVTQWAAWAERSHVHPQVIDFVRQQPDVFNDPAANPRAWSAVSKVLTTWEQGRRNAERLAQAVAGLVGDTWALAFLQFHSGGQQPLAPAVIIESYPRYRPTLRSWLEQHRLDLVEASLVQLQRHLQPQPVYEAVVADATHKTNVETFLADLPPDSRRQVRAWLAERGFRSLSVPQRPRRAKP